MVQQPMRKVWVCKKFKPYRAFFVTRKQDLVKEARKKGYNCRRWHGMEKGEASG